MIDSLAGSLNLLCCPRGLQHAHEVVLRILIEQLGSGQRAIARADAHVAVSSNLHADSLPHEGPSINTS